MKKFLALLLSLVLCLGFFSACAKGDGTTDSSNNTDTKILQPTEAVDPETLLPDEDFTGDYQNETYTAHIEKNDAEEMVVTITTAVTDGTATAWQMSGFFGDETYRINYDNAVKAVITYDSSGAEKSRENEYEDGVGRIQFTDSEHFTWHNGMEVLDDESEFVKINQEA